TLADIAAHPPKDQAKLAQVRGLSAGWKNNDIGERLMNALAKAGPLAKSELPERNGGRRTKFSKDNALVVDLLKLLLKIRSSEMNVAAKLLARAGELEQIVAGEREGLALLEGWRYEEFGRDALDLIEGRMSFTVKDGKLQMTHSPESQKENAQ
ncbi:MAG: ribonuclease D, partial [Parasphingorhabdus sp.]